MKSKMQAMTKEPEEGRAPQGARGLKFAVPTVVNYTILVAPRKGRVG